MGEYSREHWWLILLIAVSLIYVFRRKSQTERKEDSFLYMVWIQLLALGFSLNFDFPELHQQLEASVEVMIECYEDPQATPTAVQENTVVVAQLLIAFLETRVHKNELGPAAEAAQQAWPQHFGQRLPAEATEILARTLRMHCLA